MRDDEESGPAAGFALAQRVDRVADGAQRVDVEAGIGLVEDRVLRRDHGELQHLEALLLATGEAVVDVPAHESDVHVEHVELLEDQLGGISPAVRSSGMDGLAGGAQEVRDR